GGPERAVARILRFLARWEMEGRGAVGGDVDFERGLGVVLLGDLLRLGLGGPAGLLTLADLRRRPAADHHSVLARGRAARSVDREFPVLDVTDRDGCRLRPDRLELAPARMDRAPAAGGVGPGRDPRDLGDRLRLAPS